MILVAEDNQTNQLLMEQTLLSQPHEFKIVENGILVVNEFIVSSPKLILMDISMPVKDGFEATREIRQIEMSTGGRVPIIGVTAHAYETDCRKCIEAGMDDHISKPISPAAMIKLIAHWLKETPMDKVAIR